MHDVTLRFVLQTQLYCILNSFGKAICILLFFELLCGLPACNKTSLTTHPTTPPWCQVQKARIQKRVLYTPVVSD